MSLTVSDLQRSLKVVRETCFVRFFRLVTMVARQTLNYTNPTIIVRFTE